MTKGVNLWVLTSRIWCVYLLGKPLLDLLAFRCVSIGPQKNCHVVNGKQTGEIPSIDMTQLPTWLKKLKDGQTNYYIPRVEGEQSTYQDDKSKRCVKHVGRQPVKTRRNQY